MVYPKKSAECASRHEQTLLTKKPGYAFAPSPQHFDTSNAVSSLHERECDVAGEEESFSLMLCHPARIQSLLPEMVDQQRRIR